jgi:dipeptidyl aminopeptidase/acylaminoacyl peptidase
MDVAINPRGSTGYGQKFTDEISGDQRQVTPTDERARPRALGHSVLDKDRVAAAGGSYGGT